MNEWVRLALGIAVLLAITVGALTAAGVAQRQASVIAVLRAVVQLSVVALVLRTVFTAPWAVVLVLVVMFSVAVWTAARRLGRTDVLLPVALSCGAGAVVVIGIIVGLPVLSRDVRTLVAVSGIVFGGTMTAATLTGRRLRDGLLRRRDEVEGALALGATPRQACRPIARSAIYEALVPGLDQTRTVGLVTFPGAFVGALLGGVSPADAARFQIVVLAGLLCAQSISAALLAHFLGAPLTLPVEEIVADRAIARG